MNNVYDNVFTNQNGIQFYINETAEDSLNDAQRMLMIDFNQERNEYNTLLTIPNRNQEQQDRFEELAQRLVADMINPVELINHSDALQFVTADDEEDSVNQESDSDSGESDSSNFIPN